MAKPPQGKLDVLIAYMMGSLASFTEVWLKDAFRDLPLVSSNDFAILKTVEELGQPTKKEIFEATIMERTTFNESIKRLTKKGFFSESIDPSDHRLRRVTLTESGKEMTRVATEKMIGLSGLLLGPIPDGQKQEYFSDSRK